MKNYIAYFVIIVSAANISSSFAMELPEPSWQYRHQEILKKAIQQAFANMPLADMSSVERDIIALGEKNGIKNWRSKFEQFKKNLAMLTPLIKRNFRIIQRSTEDMEMGDFYYSYFSDNWLVILALLGLKPVTTGEPLEDIGQFQSYLEKLSRSEIIPIRYKLSKRDDTDTVTIVSQPLIPISKLMEWYDRPMEWMSIQQSFFEIPEELMGAEEAADFYAQAHQRMQQMEKDNNQDVDLDFLLEWAKWFDITTHHPINQTAILLGYQPYAYTRELYPDESKWQKFYQNQHNYRFLLSPEYVYLDDPTPYVPLYGKIMEFVFRQSLGDEIYSFAVASQLLDLVKKSWTLEKDFDIPQIESFLQNLFKVRDLDGFNINDLTLSDMAFFIANFFAHQNRPY